MNGMSTDQQNTTRPWYCSDFLVVSHKQFQKTQGSLKMLQYLKVARGLVLNLMLGGFGAFSILKGADPTLIGVLTISGLVLVNGIELSEWLAAKRALEELDQETDDTDGSGKGGT
jgi:hypothetical protein